MNAFKGFGDLSEELSSEIAPPDGTKIGKSIVVKGEIQGEEFLTVEGTIEGKIDLKNGILVNKTGVIKADINASSINISGKIIGNILASEKVEVKESGYIVGDIKAPRIIVNDGAVIQGKIQMEKIDSKEKTLEPGQPKPEQPLVSQPGSKQNQDHQQHEQKQQPEHAAQPTQADHNQHRNNQPNKPYSHQQHQSSSFQKYGQSKGTQSFVIKK